MNRRTLRIAHLLESDGPGGAEMMLLHLALELRSRGHFVLPIGPADGCGWLGEQFRANGVEPATFRVRSQIDFACLAGLAKLLRERRIDLIHAHEFTMAVYGAAAAMLLRRPQVVTMHGGEYYAGKRKRRIALRWACRRSAHVVAVSGATRDALSRSLELDPGEVDVIPNGVRLQQGDPQPVMRELDVQAEETLILAVGSLYPVKGHRILLEALADMISRRPDLSWRLAIAGRGGEESELRRTAERMGLAHRVHFLGYRDDVPDLLAAADVFVMPSLSEGLPLAILEAMYAGTAILASAVGGIPEVLESGSQGLLVPAGEVAPLSEGLEELVGDPSLRKRLATAAREVVAARYSIEVMTDAYEASYRSASSGA